MDENFHPVRHLLEKHRHTTFDDLKLGLDRLQTEVDKNDQAPIHFMRDNLDAFLQCYDTLSDILNMSCQMGEGLAGQGEGLEVARGGISMLSLDSVHTCKLCPHS